jgi:hypothetical protein
MFPVCLYRPQPYRSVSVSLIGAAMSYKLFPKRKSLGFAQGVTLSDRQLYAIGLVASLWALVEFFVVCIGQGLAQNDPAKKAEFDGSVAFRRRSRLLRAMVEVEIIEPWRTELLAILNRAGEVEHERDKIIHSVWGGPPVGERETGESTQIMGGGYAGRTFFKWKLTYTGAMEVARKIDAIAADLVQFQIKATGSPNFTTESALQRIRRKPDP